jgi:glycogen synthase kinase 3 beta
VDGKSSFRVKRSQRKSLSRLDLEETAEGADRKIPGSSQSQIQPEFKFLKCIGKGSFGAVFKVRELTGLRRLAAIKRVIVDPNYITRELEIMRSIDHPNCVRLWGQFLQESPTDQKERLHLVMEYFPTSLEDFIGERPYRGLQGLERMRVHIRQILLGLAYLHHRGICHRDLKPQNVLVDPDTDRVSICDFGSAKILSEKAPSVTYIGSRFYRAPELHMGDDNYTKAIDIWSVGCLVAEMWLGSPLFQGRNAQDQLRKILEVLGGSKKRALIRHESKFARLVETPSGRSLAASFPKAPAKFVAFIESILQFEASKRPSAEEALGHPFLASHPRKGD